MVKHCPNLSGISLLFGDGTYHNKRAAVIVNQVAKIVELTRSQSQNGIKLKTFELDSGFSEHMQPLLESE